MTERYFRWDFDVALVWRSTDGDVDEAQFVWDSESQIATPALIGDPSGVANYQLEIGDEDRYEVTDPDEIAAVKEALALKAREYEKDTRDADLAALRERLAAAERERDEALAANAAAVCAWQEYGRWPEMYGVVPIGRYRGPDGVEHEIALRADQITGITRGIMRHVESLLPSGLKMVEAMQNEGALKTRAETAEALVRELAPVVKVAKAVSLRPTAALFRELEDLTLGLSPAARKEIEG